MAEGGRASWRTKSSSDRSEYAIDPEQRQKYRDAMGFEPWVSWSEYYSATKSELDDWNKGKQTSSKTSSNTSSKTSPIISSPRRLETLTFDDEGNYVIHKRDKTTSSRKATISPRSIIPLNLPINRRSQMKSPPSNVLALMRTSEIEEEAENRQTLINNQWKLERMDDSVDLECTICGDVVLRRPLKWDRLFGLLPNCKHIFCLNCIVERGGTGRCPTCDKNYLQIIPSPFYVKCPSQKERMLNAMKRGEQERIKREWYVDDEPEGPIASRSELYIRPGSYYDTFDDFTRYPSTQSDSD